MIIYRNQLPARIDSADLDELAEAARASPRQRARIILHGSHADSVQEMVIAITSATYIMPHRQLDREKSYLLLRGRLGVVFFDDAGARVDRFTLGGQSGDATLLRFDAGRWHSVVSAEPLSIYIETAAGPHEGSDWADWAPKSEDSQPAREYLDQMKRLAFEA